MIYAVGDIHGQLEQLERALALIEADGGRDAPIVFLGDYVDRGPDSAGVLDRLIAGVDQGRSWTCLLGNHDRFLLNFLRDGLVTDGVLRRGLTWLHPRLGGRDTLASYLDPADLPPYEALPTEDPAQNAQVIAPLQAAARKAVPDRHRAFLTDLPLAHETADQIFVHAGIRPGVALTDQTEDDLLWIRAPFLEDPSDHGRLVVHGHTVVPAAQHYGNRVNLDSGAGYGDPISAALIDGRDAWLLSGKGRLPLRPTPS